MSTPNKISRRGALAGAVSAAALSLARGEGINSGISIGGSEGINNSSSNSPSFAGLSNYNPAYLSNYNAAVALTNAGTRNTKVVFVGDSTTAGWGAQGGAGQVNSQLFGYPSKLKFLINNSSTSSWFADKNTLAGSGSIGLGTFDNRVVLGGWIQTANAAAATMGGPMLRATGSGAALQFTPTNQVDTFDIYTTAGAAFGVMTGQIDALASPVTITQTSGSNAVVKTTITAALGAHTLNLLWVSGTVFLIGVYAYNSASKEISLVNAGWSGSKVADWNLNTPAPWDPIPFLQTFAPDLTYINLTINDWVAATNTTTFQTNLQNIITASKISGDAILMAGFPSDVSRASVAQQAQYIAIVKALAVSNNCICIDWTGFFGSWATANSNFFAYDTLHADGYGYSDIVVPISQVMNQSPAVPALDIDTSVLLSQATNTQTAPRISLVNTTIKSLKSIGAWGQFDLLYFPADADSQLAALNWAAPSAFTLANVGAGAAFVADRGFTGNGTTTAMNTAWTNSTQGGKSVLNSASVWVWSRTEGQQATRELGTNVSLSQTTLIIRNASNQIANAINDNAGPNEPNTGPTAIGMFGTSRINASLKRVWQNGIQAGTDSSTASVALPVNSAWICGANGSVPTFSTRQLAFAAWGGSMQGIELALYNVIQSWMTAVGA